jgi:hypothetical protein
MRTRLLCCVAAALATSCIKRVSPTPPDERTTYSGIALPFGQQGEIPEGSTVIWDFGDGTPPVTGLRVSHAFGPAGVYTIVETIQDKDGQTRTARTHVAALLRTLPMAVPGDVKAALLLPSPWTKVPLHREVAGKLALGNFFDEMARSVSVAAGFDALDPNAAAANGFDPAKGAAFFTVPQDPEALVMAVGTLDDAKSLEAAKRLLGSPHTVGRYGGGAFQLSASKLPDGTPLLLGQNAAGDKVAVLQRYGYLYLRTAGASDPVLSLKNAAALPPDKGLAVDPGFLNASRHVGGGDAVFYSRAAEGMRFSQELGSLAFAVIENFDVLQFRIFTTLKNLSGDQLAASAKPLRDPPDLAAKLPAGASAYLRLSAAPEALWRELSRASGADAMRLHDRVQEITGLDVEKDLIPSFAGNVGIAVYLDASSLIEAIMGEEVGSFDKSAFVMAAQLTNPDVVLAALDRAVKARGPGERDRSGPRAEPVAGWSDRAQLAGAAVFRLGDAAHAAIKDGVFYLAVGGAPPPPPAPAPKKGKKKAAPPPAKKALTLADLGVLGRVLQPPDKSQSLSQEFKRVGVTGFQVPGQQDLWVNLAGIVRSLEKAGVEQGGVVSTGARLFADRAADLRDSFFEARPNKEGVDADLWLRFLPKAAR